MRAWIAITALTSVACGGPTVVGEWQSEQAIQTEHNRLVVGEELKGDATVFIFRTVDGQQVAQGFTFDASGKERQDGDVYSFDMDCEESPFGECDAEDSFQMRCDLDEEGEALTCEADDSERWVSYEFSWRKLAE